MSTVDRPIAADWLALRRVADQRARDQAGSLLTTLAAFLPDPVTVVDVGAGTGANRVYLEPRLPMATRWVLLDHDAALLERASADERRVGGIDVVADVVREVGAGLVTCSALLDLLSRSEIDALVRALAGVGVPGLFSLTVDGSIHLRPEHPDDARVASAFNDHQRRSGRPGPAAVSSAAEVGRSYGLAVSSVPTPWRLDASDGPLVTRLLSERVAAAVEQRPEIEEEGRRWLQDRLDVLAQGRLAVRVGHVDLLLTPRLSAG